MFDNLVFVTKQNRWLFIPSPMMVVVPLIVMESDKRANERGQCLLRRRRRRDQIAAMANSALISYCAVILYKSL